MLRKILLGCVGFLFITITIPQLSLCASLIGDGVSALKQQIAEKGVSATLKESEFLKDDALVEGITKSVVAASTIGTATVSAAAAGAGSLAGYAGMASAVSSLGLGGITTTVGTMLAGHSVAGAAATAV